MQRMYGRAGVAATALWLARQPVMQVMTDYMPCLMAVSLQTVSADELG
jgi:hypothetical protein